MGGAGISVAATAVAMGSFWGFVSLVMVHSRLVHFQPVGKNKNKYII